MLLKPPLRGRLTSDPEQSAGKVLSDFAFDNAKQNATAELSTVTRPHFMTLPIWFAYLLRSDVRKGAAPGDLEAQQEFVAWWLLWARTEYPAVWHWEASQAEVAMQLVSIGSDLLCPRLLRHLHESRPDLQNEFPLNDKEDLVEFFCWYRLYGVTELAAAPELPSACLAMTESPSQRPAWSVGGLQIPRIAVVLAQRIPDLPSGDSLNSRIVSQIVIDWYKKYGRHLVPAAAIPPGALNAARPKRKPREGGVNLVGFVQSQSGLGEDVRMASAALEAVGIAHVLVNVQAGPSIPQQDNSLAHLLTDRLPYEITIYCMSAFDMASLYLHRGEAFFAGQYRVGYWPWELPIFPVIWTEAYALVDEVWAASEFTAQAYRHHCTHPVRRLPCPVTLPQVQPVPRQDLALHDEEAFVFVFPFDVNSYVTRKNPLSLVRAFRRAFPRRERRVALILRVNGIPDGHPGWLEVIAESLGDDRISILSGTFGRQKSLGIIAACDCLVSPHRAEGFGRNIAEAILLGIPVLATAFSGCTDFLAPEEEIAFETASVREGDYPFAAGLRWAEPSIDDMARRMKEIRLARQADRAGMERRLALRRSEIAATYSSLATGRAFAKRLQQIKRRLPLKNQAGHGTAD